MFLSGTLAYYLLHSIQGAQSSTLAGTCGEKGFAGLDPDLAGKACGEELLPSPLLATVVAVPRSALWGVAGVEVLFSCGFRDLPVATARGCCCPLAQWTRRGGLLMMQNPYSNML